MPFEDFWDYLDFNCGSFRFGFGTMSSNIRYRRTDKSHIVRIQIDPSIKKAEIKARLVEPGIIEVEWPRRKLGEEIPVD